MAAAAFPAPTPLPLCTCRQDFEGTNKTFALLNKISGIRVNFVSRSELIND